MNYSLSICLFDNRVDKDFLDHSLLKDFMDLFSILNTLLERMLFSDNRDMFLLNQSSMLFVDNRLMMFMDVLFINHWLIVLMNDILMMLMNDVFLVLNKYIFVMFMNHILMNLFDDWRSTVRLQNVCLICQNVFSAFVELLYHSLFLVSNNDRGFHNPFYDSLSSRILLLLVTEHLVRLCQILTVKMLHILALKLIYSMHLLTYSTQALTSGKLS